MQGGGAVEWETAMKLALAEAAVAADVSGDVPVGAVLLGPDGEVLALGRNEREALKDPSAHAEIVALRKAAADLNDWRLEECTLVVTLEPCVMCAGAIVAARIPRVVFGAWDERVGASGSLYDVLRDARLGKPVEVISGVLEAECSAQLTQFFEGRRMSGSK
jgi:tRNA(adenine34) deaminase